MGKRGPKPTPTPLLKLRGSWRAETRGGEPSPTVELPDPPLWLSEKARIHWAEIGATLEGLGIMARCHTVALAMLCESLADYLDDRTPQKRDQVLKWSVQFGTTPSAITGVRSAKTEQKTSKFPRLSQRTG